MSEKRSHGIIRDLTLKGGGLGAGIALLMSLVAIAVSVLVVTQRTPDAKASLDDVFPNTINFTEGMQIGGSTHIFETNTGVGPYGTTLAGYCMSLGKSGPVGVTYTKMGISRSTSQDNLKLSRIGWILANGYPRTQTIYQTVHTPANAAMITQAAIWCVQESSTQTGTKEISIGLPESLMAPAIQLARDSVSHASTDENHYSNRISAIYAPPSTDSNRQYVIVVTSSPRGTVKVKKTSSDVSISASDSNLYSLEGARYTLYTDPACTTPVKNVADKDTTFTIDANGFSTQVHTVPAGNYYLKETSPAPGFRIDDSVIDVTVTEAGDTSVEVSDKPVYGRIKVVKKDADTGEVVPAEGFQFTLYKKGETTALETGSTKSDGTLLFEKKLPLGEYEVLETAVPDDRWSIDTNRHAVTITQSPGTTHGAILGATEKDEDADRNNIIVIEVSDTQKLTTDATIKKIWDDNNDAAGARPSSITVKLLADGSDTGKSVTLNSGNNWQDTIKDLPTKNGDKSISYTWSEVSLPSGYKMTSNKKNGTITSITNTYTSEKTSVTVNKLWKSSNGTDVGWPDGATATLQLVADGKAVSGQTVTLTASKKSHTFENLDKFRSDGTTEISYSVTEESVTGWSNSVSTLSDGTIQVTNTKDEDEIAVTVKKVWKNADGSGTWPDGQTINVQLLANGSAVEGKVATLSADHTSHRFAGLPKVDSKGEEIVYSVAEAKITGYKSSVTPIANNEIVLTNTAETTSATIKKVWDDSNNKDGIRPASLTVTLSNGEDVTLNEGNSWQATISNLPKYDGAGKPIDYTWTEKSVPEGYVLSKTDKDGIITTITNTKEDQSIGTKLATVSGGSKIMSTGGNVTLVDTISYKNLIPGKQYEIRGELRLKDGTESGTLVPDTQVTGTLTPDQKSGTTTMEFTLDSTKISHDIVAFEELRLDGKVVAEHKDINAVSQTVEVLNPSIGTSFATVDGEKGIIVSGTGKVTLTDTVTYSELEPNKTYTLTGTIHGKEGDSDKGAIPGVSATKTFIPSASSGTETLSFELDMSKLSTPDIVAFERLTIGDQLIASHEEITDSNQTIKTYSPRIGTSFATVDGDKELLGTLGGTVTLKDTVTYSGLVPGKEYELRAEIHGKDGNADKGAIQGITATKKFVPTKDSGTEEVTFTIDMSKIETPSIVAFEKLYVSGTDTVIATHEDITDDGQTIVIKEPNIGTRLATADGDADFLLTGTGTVTLTDTVSYNGLIPNKEYTLKASIHAKKDGIDNGEIEGANATKTFTPTSASGSIDISVDVDLSKLDGTDMVAFEDLLLGGDVIASHKDISDSGQTVSGHKPSIRTSLATATGEKTVNRTTDKVTVTDAVSYYGLIPGKEYELSGVMHLRADGNDAGAIQEALATKKFTPTEADGMETLDFSIDLSAIDGEAIVAFEKLSWNGTEIATHEDITDEGQTIELNPPTIMTILGTIDNSKEALVGSGTDEIGLIDTIRYTGLTVGREYTINGMLHGRDATGKDLGEIQGSDGTISFTPESPDGTIDVPMRAKVKDFADGDAIVAFEELSYNGTTIAEHKDINDKNQSVIVRRPRIGTTLATEDGKKTVSGTGWVTLVDKVEYHGLVPGREYEMRGELHARDDSGRDTGAIDRTKGSTKFTPETTDGTIEVRMTFDLSTVKTNAIVAFEELYVNTGNKDVKLTEHKEIGDSAQSVTIRRNTLFGRASDIVQTGDAVIEVAAAVATIGGMAYVVARRRRKVA